MKFRNTLEPTQARLDCVFPPGSGVVQCFGDEGELLALRATEAPTPEAAFELIVASEWGIEQDLAESNFGPEDVLVSFLVFGIVEEDPTGENEPGEESLAVRKVSEDLLSVPLWSLNTTSRPRSTRGGSSNDLHS